MNFHAVSSPALATLKVICSQWHSYEIQVVGIPESQLRGDAMKNYQTYGGFCVNEK